MSMHWATHWSYAPSTDRAPDWREQGACRDEDPDLFFPIGKSAPALAQAAEAKAICARCPVLETCRDWALDTRLEEGVAGGMTSHERLLHRRRQRRTAS
ncbi:Transcriptional regulator WhiB1 [Streptomyces fradiae ATCC 10745 = DSM 40063]|uniref:Transcriptional regulator WhiB n=1 Tax=Streptomyces fradiae ATCC 10745 = DSM 40063 TaxID=1319510 RepID=A0A1Y2NSG6_STRFR|nr:Transcriptional regulator WhiB1 [Streptomyces fradiae ATCC 10745 = DSM 40063]